MFLVSAILMAVQGAEEGRCVAHPDLSTLVTIQALEGARCADLVSNICNIFLFCFLSNYRSAPSIQNVCP